MHRLLSLMEGFCSEVTPSKVYLQRFSNARKKIKNWNSDDKRMDVVWETKKKKKKMQTTAIAIQTKNCFKVKQRSIFGSFVEIKNALIKFFIGDYQVYIATTRKYVPGCFSIPRNNFYHQNIGCKS